MTTTNFIGIPIEGDIDSGRRSRKEQKTKEELAEILRPLLEDPRVEAFRWRQYTPYFNDGDVCEFGIHEAYFKFQGVDEEAGDYGDGFLDEYSYNREPAAAALLGSWDYDRSTSPWTRVHDGNGDPALAARVKAVSDAIPGGEFYDVLLDLFGDHAEVTVTADKIVVDSYKHD